MLHAKHHELALHLVNNVSGVWADDYFRFVIQNIQAVKDKLHATAMAITTALGGHAARERFYAYHMAGVLVAGWICRRIGAVGFDLNEIKRWALRHITSMRKSAQKYSNNTDEKFAKLISEMHGAILVTKHFDLLDTRMNTIEVPMFPLKKSPVARLVLGSDKERGKFFVSARAIDEWCAENDLTSSQFKRMLVNANLLRPSPEKGRGFDRKINLSKGVPSHPTGQCRCFELEYAAVQGYVNDVVGGNVLSINQSVATAVANESEELAEVS